MCSLHLFFSPANQINAAISAATLRSLLIKKQHLPQQKPSSSAYVFVFVRVSPLAPCVDTCVGLRNVHSRSSLHAPVQFTRACDLSVRPGPRPPAAPEGKRTAKKKMK